MDRTRSHQIIQSQNKVVSHKHILDLNLRMCGSQKEIKDLK